MIAEITAPLFINVQANLSSQSKSEWDKLITEWHSNTRTLKHPNTHMRYRNERPLYGAKEPLPLWD